jgi:hypothetical protein
LKKRKVVKQDRLTAERYDDTLHFSEEFSKLTEAAWVSDTRLLNACEIRLSMDQRRALHDDVITWNDRNTAIVAQRVDTATVTALPLVRARGECHCMYVISRK